MINPTDTSTIKAMVEARQADLVHLSRNTEVGEDWYKTVSPTRRRVNPIRRSIGITVMRVGARLAGICVQPEVSRQA